MSGAELCWIELGPGGRVPNDAARKTIRVRAMHDIAADRRKPAPWGKRDARQPRGVGTHDKPDGLSSDGEQPPEHQSTAGAGRAVRYGSTTAKRKAVRMYPVPYAKSGASSLVPARYLGSPAALLPVSGIERLVVETGVNILDLNELTHVHMGHAAGLILSQHPTTLNRLVSRRRESFLSHLPRRYGTTPCLDDAIRCVAIKAKRFLVPGYATPTAVELSLYGKALQSLQMAVDDSDGWSNPDTLCAIHILSMYELLDFPSATLAWEKHISGAMLLIRMRGPDNFNDDFEKSLLLSLMAPFICECLRLGQPCFFEEPAWQQALLSAANKDDLFTPQSRTYVRLSLLCAFLPRLFSAVAKAVFAADVASLDDLDSTEDELQKIEKAILKWRHGFALLARRTASSQCSSVEKDHKMQLDAASLGMLAVTSRLRSAISTDRLGAELRSLGYVDEMQTMLLRTNPTNPWANFYLGQKIVMPHSILTSTKLWLKPTQGQGRVIEEWKFKAWMNTISKTFVIDDSERHVSGTSFVCSREVAEIVDAEETKSSSQWV